MVSLKLQVVVLVQPLSKYTSGRLTHYPPTVTIHPLSLPSTFTESLDFSCATLDFNPFCSQCSALLASGFGEWCINTFQCLPCMTTHPPTAASCFAYYNSSTNHNMTDTLYVDDYCWSRFALWCTDLHWWSLW